MDAEKKASDNIVAMLTSDDPEMFNLGLEVCRKQFPGVWAALIGYTGRIPPGGYSEEFLVTLSSIQAFTMGSVVRYRGLSGSPDMVITKIDVTEIDKSLAEKGKGKYYYCKATCKYWNRSKQEFCSVEERLECLEIIPQTIKTEKDGL